MTKLEKKEAVILIVGILLVVVVIIVGGILLFGNNSNENNNDEPQMQIDVTPEEVNEVYETLTAECTGAMVWNLNEGETVEITDVEQYTTACQTDNYYSKMLGYTSDENDDLVIHVNVLKKVDNYVYKLDDTLVGEYSEENIDTLLDGGSTYIYTYVKNNDSYVLSKVELMETNITEPTE